MTPFFLESPTGRLFAVYWPSASQAISHAFLHVPAFAEEMNKSRRMVAMQARALAERGHAVLVLDLFGTGDSDGDFGEASWEGWLSDLDAGITWLTSQGFTRVDLWGLRTGALLAMDFVERNPTHIQRLLLWQPVLNGDTFVTQFLRLRVAAAMMSNNIQKEKTSDLKRQLLDGQAIEVAGYLLNPNLINPLIALRADRLSLPNIEEVASFEMIASDDTPVSIVNSQFLDILQKKQVNASLTKVIGQSFWGNQEIIESPDLIKLSCERVEEWK